jgi:hypothetical protein
MFVITCVDCGKVEHLPETSRSQSGALIVWTKADIQRMLRGKPHKWHITRR